MIRISPTIDRAKIAYGKGRDRYLELVLQFPLRRIQSENESDDATKVIHCLIDQDELTPAEDDYLDVLSTLVEEYEEIHYPPDDVTDGQMLAYFLELKEVSQTQLSSAVGIATSTISEVLSGKRKLTRGQIEKLSKYFHVTPDVFFPKLKPTTKGTKKKARKST